MWKSKSTGSKGVQFKGKRRTRRPSRPLGRTVMASGWRVGYGHAVLRLTSFTPRASQCRANIDALLRAFLGWLRGEKRHCTMVAIPTVEEEDARRPNRERGNLVTEQTRIVNQIKAILTRFGIRTFRPTLRKAEEHLEGLRTAEGIPLLENPRAELRRHLARLHVVREQRSAARSNRAGWASSQ